MSSHHALGPIAVALACSCGQSLDLELDAKEKWSIEKMAELEKPHEERNFTACGLLELHIAQAYARLSWGGL